MHFSQFLTNACCKVVLKSMKTYGGIDFYTNSYYKVHTAMLMLWKIFVVCCIMYVGIVGTLSNREQSVGLYLSYDGGFSWREVVNYMHVVQL